MIKNTLFPWDNQHKIDIIIPLKWSRWYKWGDLEKGEITIPNTPGVYEVRSSDFNKCLDIGKAEKLNKRVLNQLIKGKGRHSTRDRIKLQINDFNELVVRWSETGNPAALEEYLHLLHKALFGIKPELVRKT